MPEKISLVGQTFGKLTVIADAESRIQPNGRPRRRSLCQCSCGATCVSGNGDLRTGNTKSCGCILRENPPARKHGHSHPNGKSASRTYSTWLNMWRRCTDSTIHNFKNYGGRGITVCNRWNDFCNFLSDMGEKPKGLTLERVDTHGNYEKSNCIWATQLVQGRNKTNNHVITVNGITGCLSKMEELFGIKATTIRCRLRNGWDETRAATTPLLRLRRSALVIPACSIVSKTTKPSGSSIKGEPP